MNAEHEIVPVIPGPVAPASLPADLQPRDGGSGDRAQAIIAAIRRRPRLALILAVIGLVLGAVVGYISAPRAEYRSAGQIRIKPYLPRMIYQTEQSAIMPMFDSFAETQVALITSQRVVELAMQSPTWKDRRPALMPASQTDFAARLAVRHPRGGELIEVAFTDAEPQTAMAAVKAVIEAYMKLYGETESETSAQRSQILEERRVALNAEVKAINDRVTAIGDEFGSTALDRMYDFELDEVNKLEAELHQVQVALAVAASSRAETAVPGPAAAKPSALSIQAIARQDPQMRELLWQKRQREQDLERLKMRFGSGHRSVEEAVGALQALDKSIEQFAQEYRDGVADGAIQIATGASLLGIDAGQLRQRERNLQALVDGARTRMLDLGRKRLQIQSLQRDAEEKQARLSETKTRIEQLSVESSVGGRISVLSYGDEPLAPYKSSRNRLAGGLGMLGALLGICAVVARGLMDTRCTSIDDACSVVRRRTSVLGVLPSLPENLNDPEQAAIAAHYVHHIRTMLQISMGYSQAAALAVTSAMPGSGKTSLAVALGLSFAASGARTLLIDCDMVGGGLTARMGAKARAKLGQILRRNRLITQEQLETALEQCRRSGRRLGQQLLGLGYITELDLDRALASQQTVSLGLLDVLAGEDLRSCVAETRISNLAILPLGTATSQDIARLSPEAVHAVIAEAKQHFDSILIDTGPVPGSIEAAMVAAEADKVVLVIAQGESRALAEQAIAHLHSLGADIAGAVFNRADTADILASKYGSSVSTRSMAISVPRNAAGEAAIRLGPIATAVASVSREDEAEARP